jgi:hypothetical protein
LSTGYLVIFVKKYGDFMAARRPAFSRLFSSINGRQRFMQPARPKAKMRKIPPFFLLSAKAARRTPAFSALFCLHNS